MIEVDHIYSLISDTNKIRNGNIYQFGEAAWEWLTVIDDLSRTEDRNLALKSGLVLDLELAETLCRDQYTY